MKKNILRKIKPSFCQNHYTQDGLEWKRCKWQVGWEDPFGFGSVDPRDW